MPAGMNNTDAGSDVVVAMLMSVIMPTIGFILLRDYDRKQEDGG